jgi:flap endonuclease-1
MGIKNLTQLIKSKAPKAIHTDGMYSLKDKTIAIDASILIYKSLVNVRHNQSYLTNKNGKVVSHIVGLFHKTIQFLSFGITPIYIFDGKPPAEKREVILERNKKAAESKNRMEKTDILEEKQKLEKSTIRINKDHIDDLKHLFTLMGVQFIQPEGEAETYAAHLCKTNKVYGVYSEDMDTLSFGSPILIRNCIDRTIKRKEAISIFSLKDILEGFNMNYEQFVEVCILCGCDYCDTISKIGNVRAFQAIQKHNSLESFLATLEPSILPPNYLQRSNKAKELFINYSFPDYHHETPSIDTEQLTKYLVEDCSMAINRVQNALKKIK